MAYGWWRGPEGRKMDREEWIKEARRGFGPLPSNAGEVSIYGSQAGKDDAAGQLTQFIDGRTDTRMAKHRTYARYGTRERWRFTDYLEHLSAGLRAMMA